jgi:hypothetical protein
MAAYQTANWLLRQSSPKNLIPKSKLEGFVSGGLTPNNDRSSAHSGILAFIQLGKVAFEGAESADN